MATAVMAESPGFNRVSFEKNGLLFDEGQTGDAAYLITKGEVEVRTGVRGESPRVLARRGKGAIVGEMALFDNRPRMAAVIAMTPVETIKISRDEFRHRLDEMDPVMRSILLLLVRRLRQMNDELADLKRTDWRPAGS